MQINKQAFTLIELLVVVLIIGILAAVALPQYRVAVAKTRFSNLQTLARTYARAAEIAKLENGVWPRTFETLSVDVPGGSTLSSANLSEDTCASNEEMYCCITGYVSRQQYEGIYCGLLDYSLAYGWEPQFKRNVCMAANNTYLEQVCKSSGGKEHNAAGNHLIIPGGYRSGYNRYDW